MAEGMKVSGWTTICMEKESIHGKMVESMMENMLKIKNMGMEHIFGLMVENVK